MKRSAVPGLMNDSSQLNSLDLLLFPCQGSDQEIRDTIIHDTEYDGLKMLYRPNGQKVGVGFPRLNGVPIFEFVERFWTNLIDFCEEAMVLALCTRMPPLIAIDRIPENERTTDLPYRWRGFSQTNRPSD